MANKYQNTARAKHSSYIFNVLALALTPCTLISLALLATKPWYFRNESRCSEITQNTMNLGFNQLRNIII